MWYIVFNQKTSYKGDKTLFEFIFCFNIILFFVLLLEYSQGLIPASFAALVSGAVMALVGITPTTGNWGDLIFLAIFLVTPFALGWGVVKLDAD